MSGRHTFILLGVVGTCLSFASASLNIVIQTRSKIHPEILLFSISGYLLSTFILGGLVFNLNVWDVYCMTELILYLINLGSGLSVVSNAIKDDLYVPDRLLRVELSAILIFILQLTSLASFGSLMRTFISERLVSEAFKQIDLEKGSRSSAEMKYITSFEGKEATEQVVIKKASDKTLVEEIADFQPQKYFIKNSGGHITTKKSENITCSPQIDNNWIYGNNLTLTFLDEDQKLGTNTIFENAFYPDIYNKVQHNIETSRLNESSQEEANENGQLATSFPIVHCSRSYPSKRTALRSTEVFHPLVITQSRVPHLGQECFEQRHSTGHENSFLEGQIPECRSTCSKNRTKTNEKEFCKAIQEERLYLQTVNQSLLPPLLKNGESPIAKLKLNFTDINSHHDMRSPDWAEPECYSSPRVAGNEPNEISSPYNTSNFNLADSPSISRHCNESFQQNIYSATEDFQQNCFRNFDQNTDIVSQMADVDNYKEDNTYPDKISEKANSLIERREGATPNDYSNVLSGLEEIPKAEVQPLAWTNFTPDHSVKMRNISLQEWNDNQDVWNDRRVRSGIALQNITNFSDDTKGVDENKTVKAQDSLWSAFKYPSYRSHSKSLSSLSTSKKMEHDILKPPKRSSFDCLSTFKKSATDSFSVIEATPNISDSTSKKSLRKLSPIRLSGFLRRTRSKTKSISETNQRKFHMHTGSVFSFQSSIKTHKSSRSISPKKSIKSFLSRSPTKTKFHFDDNSDTESRDLHIFLDFNEYQNTGLFENSSLALEPVLSSDKSRVSSIPSAVIGEYDKEKWRTLKQMRT